MGSAILQITSGEHAGQTFLMEGAMTVGRDTGTQIRINDRSISRKHATIEQRDGNFYVIDLGSQNGTKLNGAPVTESMLPSSCKLQFGGVEAEFNLVSAEPTPAAALPAKIEPGTDSGWESLPPDGEAVLDDIFRPPGSLDEIEERAAKRKSEAQKKIFDFAYVIGMILIVVIGVLIYLSADKRGRIPKQDIIVEKYAGGKGERVIRYRGKGRYYEITVTDDHIARVTPDEEYWWLLTVRGEEMGETKAFMTDKFGEVLGILTIVVRGNLVERTRRVRLPDNECISRARRFVEQADILRQDSISWQALKLYEQAAALCRSIDPTPALYSQARNKARALSRKINDEVVRLKGLARMHFNRPASAAKYLNEICRLVPDESDKRHQWAKIILYWHYPKTMREPVRRRIR